jgi:hypothetical protein
MRALALVATAAVSLGVTFPAAAKVEKFAPAIKTQTIKVEGAEIYVRTGGKGPAVVMLHGFGDTGDMWAPTW